MCQALTCGRVLARARVQVLQNSGSQMVVLRFTTLSAWDSHLQNARKKNYRELSNIKSTLVSALTGSVPRKIAEAWQEFQLSSGIEPKLPDSLRITLITEPKVRINWPKKTVYDSLFLATWNRFFCVQDCRSRIVQVEYQDQTRYTRILESWDRSSISSHGWLVSNTVDECLQRQIAQKIFKSKIEGSPVIAGATLVTTRPSNISFHLWPIWQQTLVAIDSESRLTSFPSICARHLKSLGCSIRIWADASSSDRSSIQTCWFAQDSIRNMRFCS